ncbi:MAG: outer membrane protein assembly factor BamA [Candidatus Krumholzibacteriota bacterium]|nr:outer membrane protein assembly factor BamA [Candidatus Krumholzibacteriota bacterium]
MARTRLACMTMTMLLLLAAPAIAQRIDRIEVRGNRNISAERIISIFGLREGVDFRPEAVTAGIKRLVRSKDFADIRAFRRIEGGAVTIVLEVQEYPRVSRVVVEGTDKLKKSDVEAKILLREGFFARPSIMTKDAEAIRALYAEKGYNRTRVETVTGTPDDDGRAVVLYRIREGGKIKIRHIDFLGNGQIDSKTLRDAMESSEDRWWRGGDLKPKQIEEDLKTLRRLYENEGYLDATVELASQEEVDGGGKVDLFIAVDEGPRYVLGDITWSGNETVTDEEIAALITVEEGDPYAREMIEIGQVGQVNSLYWERGYIWSRVIPERSIRRRRIDLDLQIVENDPAYIREIKISGNAKTFEDVIRREFRTYPGDKFELNRVQRSLRDVFQLGYFAGPPNIDTEPVNDAGDINLLIAVEEKQTGNFKFGFGFSQLYSASGFFGIQEPNFLGRGNSIALDWEFGKYRTNLNCRYTEPNLFGTETAFTVNLFNWILDRVQQLYYTDRRKGFSLQLGHPFPLLDYTRISGSYRLEQVELSNFSESYPETGALREVDWPLNKSSFMLSLTRNSTDSPFHPTTGSVTSLSTEFAGGPLGGNVKFIRYTAGMSWFRNIFWKFTFHLDMTAGLIDDFGGAGGVQDYEKYRLGGNRRYALRGYDFYEVVPDGNDAYVGGNFMTTFTQEILFPFSSQVYGLIFLDAGNVWNSFGEANIFDLRRGLGLGVRLEMPGLGNLGFDYGYGFDKDGAPGWEPHFTFGTFF